MDLSIDSDDLAQITNMRSLHKQSDMMALKVKPSEKESFNTFSFKGHARSVQNESLVMQSYKEALIEEKKSETLEWQCSDSEETVLRDTIRELADFDNHPMEMTSSSRVLIVDNNICYAFGLINSIKMFGVQCDVAYSADDALSKVKQRS